MKKTNSYIFIEKKEKEQKELKKENVDGYIRLKQSILEIIKKTFKNVAVSELPINYYEFYAAGIYKGTFELEYIANMNSVEFKLTKIQETTYLDITVEDISEVKCINYLEEVNKKLSGTGNPFENNYVAIISYDSISQYYCNKIYPKLNIFERKLRKLLFNIYTVNFGMEYFTKTTNIELQNKIKGRVKIRGNKEKIEYERIKLYFYSLEYGDIQDLLFISKWTELDEKRKHKFLLNNSDLSKLPDDILRKEFESTKPRSDWDRFFADKIYIEDISNIFKKVSEYRNQIAHFKFFYHDDYVDCNKLLKKLIASIDKAIQITEEVDFKNKNKEHLDEIYDSIGIAVKAMVDKWVNIVEGIQDAMQPCIKIIGTFAEKLTQNYPQIMNTHMDSDCEVKDEENDS